MNDRRSSRAPAVVVAVVFDDGGILDLLVHRQHVSVFVPAA